MYSRCENVEVRSMKVIRDQNGEIKGYVEDISRDVEEFAKRMEAMGDGDGNGVSYPPAMPERLSVWKVVFLWAPLPAFVLVALVAQLNAWQAPVPESELFALAMLVTVPSIMTLDKFRYKKSMNKWPEKLLDYYEREDLSLHRKLKEQIVNDAFNPDEWK